MVMVMFLFCLYLWPCVLGECYVVMIRLRCTAPDIPNQVYTIEYIIPKRFKV